jgi:desulfoferrodoxin-like iron-binding protein
MVNVSAKGQVYHCEIWGTWFRSSKSARGELVCCGQPMVLEEG